MHFFATLLPCLCTLSSAFLLPIGGNHQYASIPFVSKALATSYVSSEALGERGAIAPADFGRQQRQACQVATRS